jgi:hypothetical protein
MIAAAAGSACAALSQPGLTHHNPLAAPLGKIHDGTVSPSQRANTARFIGPIGCISSTAGRVDSATPDPGRAGVIG